MESTAPVVKLTDLPVGTVIKDEEQGNRMCAHG